jgi:hypothetical protein
LEFGNVAWSPRLQKDKDLIEGVLRRATKLVPGMNNLSYEERLKIFKLPTMQYRRDRGDMIEVYKYVHGKYSVNRDLLAFDKGGVTRGHRYKLLKQRTRLSVRQNFFSCRVVDSWNNLPDGIVCLPTLDDFKCCLDHHWAEKMYKLKSEN